MCNAKIRVKWTPLSTPSRLSLHDDVIKWKQFPRYWPFFGEFPSQRPVTRSFHVFFDLPLNKRPSKQSWSWWFETPSHSLRRHCNMFQDWYTSDTHTASCESRLLSKARTYQPLHNTVFLSKMYFLNFIPSKCNLSVWNLSSTINIRSAERFFENSSAILNDVTRSRKVPQQHLKAKTFRGEYVAITVPDDGLAPWGARASAGTVMTRCGSRIFTCT